MADNAINKMDFLDQAELDLLCERYGQKNVEQTMIYITQQLHPTTDLQVNVPYTATRVEQILDAVHGEYLNG
jgi:hypothetical protein